MTTRHIPFKYLLNERNYFLQLTAYGVHEWRAQLECQKYIVMRNVVICKRALWQMSQCLIRKRLRCKFDYYLVFSLNYFLVFIVSVKMKRNTDEFSDFFFSRQSSICIKIVSNILVFNVQDADKNIIKWLKENGRLINASSFKHSYPFCWR